MAADAAGAGDVLDRRTVRGGARLLLRVATTADVAGVRRLYEGLTVEDRHRRFHASLPSDRVLTRWLTVDDMGLALVVETDIPGGRREIIAEAGFRLGDGGQAEFAVTVDPAWRGGVGAWMVEHLQRLADHRGLDHLAAHLFVDNQPMRGLLERLGYATIDRPDHESMRVVVATVGTTPPWPDGDGPRVLVEADGGHWFAEQALRQAGYEVAVCPGPQGRRWPCPLLSDGDCPLVDGADLVVTALRGPEGARLHAVHERAQARASVPISGSPTAALEAVRGLLPAKEADRSP